MVLRSSERIMRRVQAVLKDMDANMRKRVRLLQTQHAAPPNDCQ